MDVMDYPILRILLYLALVGFFFYRDWPGPKFESKWWYVRILFYWLVFVLFLGYYGLAGAVSAGVSELFSKYAGNGTVSPTLVDQLTITSLGLLFIFRLFNRYIEATDESNMWITDFIKGIVTSYVAIGALFYAFADYLSVSPDLESFSGTPLAYSLLGIFFAVDFVLWFRRLRK